MPQFKIPFKKTVYGFIVVDAKDIEHARSRDWEMELEEVDNNSSYEYDDSGVEEHNG